MYLHLNKNQFPRETVEIIQSEINTDFDSIDLLLYEDLNEVLTESTLNEFMDAIALIPEEIPLSLANIDLFDILNDESLEILMSNSAFIKRLDKPSFLQLITSSNKAAELALISGEVQNKLNNIEPELYKDLGLLPQTFPQSCAACAILMVLKERGLIKQEEVNRTKELEIYKEIWIGPSSVADPEKIINYFRKYNIPIIGFEIDERSSDWLKAEKFFSENTFKKAKLGYSFFKQATKENYIEINQGDKIDESYFKPGTISLLVSYLFHPENNTHILLGTRRADDTFEVINPDNGTKTTYRSFNDFYNSDQNFMGISFNIKLERPK